jgi:hypothetical protein
MYDYTQEFKNLTQYEGHHVDSDAKKADLYRKRLNIQLQDRLVQNLNLSYNDLANAAIDQEGTMRACEVVEEKKRKRTTPRPTGGSSSGAPAKYVWFTHHSRNSRTDLRSSRETASSFSHSSSNNSTPMLHSLRSTRGS